MLRRGRTGFYENGICSEIVIKMIYLDNAATSFPKPECVSAAVENYIKNVGANPGRGAYGSALSAGRTALKLRMAACRLFNFSRPDHVVITPGCTAGLNMVIKGLIKAGDRVIVTPLQHNSVMRPLRQLEKEGVKVTVLSAEEPRPEALAKAITPDTKLVIACHGCNVSGDLEDLESLGKICRENSVFFLVDGAQTAGHIPIDFQNWGISALVVPGHKGLMGPQGIGLLLITPELSQALDPLICGGTGSISDLEEMPDFMPDKLEAGTLNVPGIYGLEASLSYIEKTGVEDIHKHIEELTNRFIDSLEDIPEIRVIGSRGGSGTVSLDFKTVDNAEAASILEQEYGILTRCGLHCAPAAHRALGTFPKGTVRFSFSFFNTKEDIDNAAEAVKDLIK